jgi:hypothetical protein
MGCDGLSDAGNRVDYKNAFKFEVDTYCKGLAEKIRRISKRLGYSSPRRHLTPIIRKMGYKIGDHTLEWFLNKNGPAFNPTKTNLQKFKELYKELRRRFRIAFGYDIERGPKIKY